uniref:Alpha and gamma adaptin binding protein n=1 Tax=Eptatretus burgeri TaxID=7764 RepID=A0A8C4Q6Q4_EPTBU
MLGAVAVLGRGCCPDHIVTRILGEQELPAAEDLGEDVKAYPWHIDNKYYCADVHLCVVPHKTLGERCFGEAVEACLLCFDGSQKEGLRQAEEWLPFISLWVPEVLILVCERIHDDGVPLQEVQEWCVRHGFELVELEPPELPDEEDDFPESTGIGRIIQALNAHVWPGLHMKEPGRSPIMGPHVGDVRHRNRDGNERTLLLQESEKSSRIGHGVETETPTEHAHGDGALESDIQELAALTTAHGDPDSGFERLFEKLKQMKDRAAFLPREDRKAHAEKVAKAFWVAIGGEEDEIAGLSSEED